MKRLGLKKNISTTSRIVIPTTGIAIAFLRMLEPIEFQDLKNNRFVLVENLIFCYFGNRLGLIILFCFGFFRKGWT